MSQYMYANLKPSHDNAHYWAVQTTASQLLDKLHDVSTSVTQSCDCKYAAISRYISQTVQASAKVTIECEYKVVCNLSKDTEWSLTWGF